MTPEHARSIYRDQYRMTRKKAHGAHGANTAPVDYAKFAARSGFYLSHGKFVGMDYQRVFKGLNADCWGDQI